jgi:cell division protein FtsW (lipid II flippase)
MNQVGLIRIVVGLLMVLGAVGGMENPKQAQYLVEQMIIAFVGLGLMMWAARDINRRANELVDSLRR